MKYIVECEKKIKCLFVVDAKNDDEADKKLSAGEYELKKEIAESRNDYLGCQYVRHEKGNVISSINDLCKYLDTTPEQIERDMFKNTRNGIPFLWDDDKVTLCAYAEGADGEPSHDLLFPFMAEEFDKLLEYVEEESDELWHMYNDDDEEDEEE